MAAFIYLFKLRKHELPKLQNGRLWSACTIFIESLQDTPSEDTVNAQKQHCDLLCVFVAIIPLMFNVHITEELAFTVKSACVS